MKPRILLILALAGICPMFVHAESFVVMSGSGDDTEVDKTPETDTDIYIDGGSGAIPDIPDVEVDIEFSGDGEIETDPNMKCTTMACWCVYDNGKVVEGTRTYVELAKGCKKYAGVNPKPTNLLGSNRGPLPDEGKKVTEGVPTQDIVFVDVTTSKPSPPAVTEKSETAPVVTRPTRKPSTKFNNKVTEKPPKVVVDEDKEEEKNEIGGSNSYSAVQKDEPLSAGGLYISHPGILAAVIGGGVVGLLCAILLVMFIIYRLRKKDEGSYPLNDSKPLNNYAYSKAPSREFYA